MRQIYDPCVGCWIPVDGCCNPLEIYPEHYNALVWGDKVIVPAGDTAFDVVFPEPVQTISVGNIGPDEIKITYNAAGAFSVSGNQIHHLMQGDRGHLHLAVPMIESLTINNLSSSFDACVTVNVSNPG